MTDSPVDAETWHPRSGFEEAGGYVWLPRMLDKVRYTEAHPEVPYLVLEASPLDAFFLSAHRLKGDQVRAWVRAGMGDAAIAEAITNHTGADAAARQAWSRGFQLRWLIFLKGLDADEGRLAPGVGTLALKALVNTTFFLISRLNVLRGI